MMAAWMTYGVIVAAFVSGIAFALDGACRLLGLPRRWTWGLAMAASVLAPVAALVAGRPASGPAVPLAAPVLSAVSASTDLTLVPETWMQELARLSYLDIPLQAFWVTATFLLLGVLTAASLRIRRESRRWLAAEIDGVPVLVAPDVGPAVIGTFPSAIVVPNWLAGLDQERRRTVVQHEREHLVRGDTRVLQFGLVLTALVPWMLPLWWQFKRLRETIELDCDRRVLQTGITTLDYARLLLELSGKKQPYYAPATTLAERPSLLARRIDSMLDQRRTYAGPRLAGLGLIAGLLTIAACDTPLPPQDIPVATSPRDAVLDTPPRRISGPAPRYPTMLRRAGVEGTVVVRFRVNVDGTVDSASAEVLESTNRAFNGPALEVLRRSRFEPATVKGNPVATSIQQRVTFALSSSADKEPPADIRIVGREPLTLQFGPADRTTDTTLVFMNSPVDGAPVALSAEDGPLVFINDERATAIMLDRLSPDRIERVEVLKGSAAAALYGDEARNGVIQIKLKPTR